MTSRRFVSSYVLAAALGACLLAHGAAASAQEIDTLARIKQTGVITIGSRDSSIPFSYTPKGGSEPVGFSNDICLKIVDAIKAKLGLPTLRVQYTLLNSLNRIPLMQNGTVDLDCATTTNSVVRQQQVAFAPSHFVAGITVAVKKDSSIHSLADLAGKTVATVSGSTSVQLLRTYKRAEAMEVREISGKDTADAFLLLANGRADAYVLDDVQLAGLIATAPNPGDYRMLRDVVLRQEPYGIMFRKNDPQFEAVVDEAVTKLMKNGEMERLYARWFTQPIPPNNVNLNFPMTDAVREAYRNPSKKGV